jgi:hypothetical protein
MEFSRALVSALLIGAAFGQVATPPLPENDPLVGTWQDKRGKKPSYIRTIARDGEELVFSSQGNGLKPSEHNFRVRCDGLFHPVPFGSESCKYVAPNVVEGESKSSKDKTASYWKREVSADGQKMLIYGYTDSRKTMQLGPPEVLYRVK